MPAHIPGGNDATAQGVRHAAVQERRRARFRRARRDDEFRRSAAMGDVLIAWENEAFLALKEFGTRQVRDRRAVGEHPGRAAGGGRRQGGGQARHAQARRGLSGVPVHASKGRRSPRATSIVRVRRKVPARTDGEVPEAEALHRSTIRSAAGNKAQKTHFADGGVFDSIYQPQ